MNQEERATYIGMDLGAFKTSVASSNGHREVVQTAVAKPTDLVARTMLGNEPVFGAEAMQYCHRVCGDNLLALYGVRPSGRRITSRPVGASARSGEENPRAASRYRHHGRRHAGAERRRGDPPDSGGAA